MQREKDHAELLLKAERLIAVSPIILSCIFFLFFFFFWLLDDNFNNNNNDFLAASSVKARYLIALSFSLCLLLTLFFLVT